MAWESDSELGDKPSRGPRRSAFLTYLGQLPTRRLVVYIAALTLIPSFLTLYHFQDRDYVSAGVENVKPTAGAGNHAKPPEAAAVQSSKDHQTTTQVVAAETTVIEVPEYTPSPGDEKAPKPDWDAAEEKQDVPDKTQDVPEKSEDVPAKEQDAPEKEQDASGNEQSKPEGAHDTPGDDDDEEDDDSRENTKFVPEDGSNSPPVESQPPVVPEQSKPTTPADAKKPEEPEGAKQPDAPKSTVKPDAPADSNHPVAVPENPEKPIAPESTAQPDPPPPANPQRKKVERRVIPLIAVDGPSPDLCKLMFSGMANGYPAPVIINWGNEGNRAFTGVDQSHLYKIPKALEYLDLMMGPKAHPDDKIHEDDLILLIDGWDIWWQLPPAIFIKRFDEINQRAHERLAKEWGKLGNMPMKQTIVAGAQKRCTPEPKFGFNIQCDALPESPLRPDLYGEQTDKGDNPRIWRPRNYNAGTIYGHAGDMRRFMRRALDRISRIASHTPLVQSDQGMWAEVWSEQEVFRNWLKKQPNRAEKAFQDDPAMKIMMEMFELHVGIDYAQELAIPTAFSEYDGAMVKFSNQTFIDGESQKLGISPVRLQGLPQDVLSVQPPMQKILPEENTPGWNDLTLYADFYTETVPAILHHNAYDGDLKKRREWWWDSTWYFPYLRRLGLKYLEQPVELEPLAQFESGDEELIYRALPSEKTKRKPRRFTPEMVERGLPEMEFDETCKAKPGEKYWFDEVFRDNLGPF